MPTPRPFGPGGRARRQIAGGTPATLPQATTLPATGLTSVPATSTVNATLNGSVNPQTAGAASAWFAWGQGPTYGLLTATQTGLSGSVPILVQALVNLIPGVTYHFAVVVQTSAGTVYGADQSFVATPPSQVTNASTPLNPYGQQVAVPHFAYPFAITASGASVVEQDSLDDVFGCVQAIAACRPGDCPELPSLGMPDLAFGHAPLDVLPAVSALQQQEPRATQDAVAQALDQAGSQWQLSLTTQTVGTGAN